MRLYKSLKGKMLGLVYLILIIIAAVRVSYGQTSLNELKPSQYFDFWIGEWKLTWEEADGSVGTGTNSIERILNGKVIKENFEATSGSMKGFTGKSYSVCDVRTDEWKQTWVDNSGGYLDFVGKFEGDNRIFIREGKNSNGNPIMQRMFFYDITEDSFTWIWQKSTDNGENWQLQWKIAYRRH